MYDLEKINEKNKLKNQTLEEKGESGETKRNLRLITSKAHTDEQARNILNEIPKTALNYRGGCGFKSLQLIDDEADCFLYPNRGYKRYIDR